MSAPDGGHPLANGDGARAVARSGRWRIAGALLAALALVLVATPSGAGTLASAVLLSTDASELDCFVSNVATRPVTVTGVSIQNGGNTILSLSADSCGSRLEAGANCVFSAALDARFSARGTITFLGSAKGLRGQCQLTSSASHLIASSDLR